MKKNILFLLLFVFSICTHCQENSHYLFEVDLTNPADDKLKIILFAPKMESKATEYIFPVSSPGFYNNNLQNAELVRDFKAFSKEGKPLKCEKSGKNRWTIFQSDKLYKIEYWIEDMWEVKDQFSHWLPVENIFDSSQVFLINPVASFGYFAGKENLSFRISIQKPEQMFLTSGLQPLDRNNGKDVFEVKSYFELAESPIYYTNQPPVAFKVGNTNVEVAVYSESGTIDATRVSKVLEKSLKILESYLGGKLPVDHYSYLFYFYSGEIFTQSASEHVNSSVYVWPEKWNPELLKSSDLEEGLMKVGLHEFLHIYAPLTIHSVEKQSFEFGNPVMSKHLWLYEGTTEYLTMHAQLQEKVISENAFIDNLNDLLKEMKAYREDVSLVEVSLRTYGDLDDEYDNVELKGVIVNLLLDIYLLKGSEGTYGLKKLVVDLSNKYGRDRAFKDDELFNQIAKMTFPDVEQFLQKYVGGTDPLPIKELLQHIGYNYSEGENKIYLSDNLTEKQGKLRRVWGIQ